jgi:hypothetical protein
VSAIWRVASHLETGHTVRAHVGERHRLIGDLFGHSGIVLRLADAPQAETDASVNGVGSIIGARRRQRRQVDSEDVINAAADPLSAEAKAQGTAASCSSPKALWATFPDQCARDPAPDFWDTYPNAGTAERSSRARSCDRTIQRGTDPRALRRCGAATRRRPIKRSHRACDRESLPKPDEQPESLGPHDYRTRFPGIGRSRARGARRKLLTAALIAALLPFLARHALAKPNPRSSHVKPTPQGGGAAVIAATMIVALVAAMSSPHLPRLEALQLAPLFAVVVFLSAVGAVDDISPLGVWPRLVLQFAATIAMIALLPRELRVLPDVPLWLERAIEALFSLWFINVTNFMDGIDWMTVAEVLPVTVGLSVLGLLGALPGHGLVLRWR